MAWAPRTDASRPVTDYRVTPSSDAPRTTGRPAARLGVEGGQSRRGVEIVVEARARTAVRARRLASTGDVLDRPGRAPARRPAGRPPGACRRPSTPSRGGSGGRAGPGGPPPAPTPSAGRRTKTRLPRDFDIFVPSRPTRPTCSQWRTNGRPVTDSDWAVSHSWWGKTRSRPPPWTSTVSPSSRRASAEHSMCQPGSARSPARLPRRLVGQRRLPQHEVERVPLVGVVGIAAVLGGQGQHGRPRRGG